jgi:hypothetical protein
MGSESRCGVLIVEALVLAELGFAHLTVGVAVAVLTATLHGGRAREDAHHCEHGEHAQTYVHVRKGIALLLAREPCPERRPRSKRDCRSIGGPRWPTGSKPR